MQQQAPILWLSFLTFFLAAVASGVIALICLWGEPSEALMKALATALTVLLVSGVVISGYRTAFSPHDEA